MQYFAKILIATVFASLFSTTVHADAGFDMSQIKENALTSAKWSSNYYAAGCRTDRKKMRESCTESNWSGPLCRSYQVQESKHTVALHKQCEGKDDAKCTNFNAWYRTYATKKDSQHIANPNDPGCLTFIRVCALIHNIQLTFYSTATSPWKRMPKNPSARGCSSHVKMLSAYNKSMEKYASANRLGRNALHSWSPTKNTCRRSARLILLELVAPLTKSQWANTSKIWQHFASARMSRNQLVLAIEKLWVSNPHRRKLPWPKLASYPEE